MKRFLPLLLIALVALPFAGCDRISQSAFDLEPGDCFKVPEEDEISDVQRAPCNEPHDGEVLFVGNLPDGESVPDGSVIEAWVEANCNGEAFTNYVGRTYEEATDIQVTWFFPTADSWADGDREVTCILAPVEGGTVSNSYRASPAAS